MLLLLPVDAAAQKPRASGDRGSGDRSSGSRGSGDRNSADRGSGDRGDRNGGDRNSGDRRADQRRSDQRFVPSNPSMPWWENQPTPWWERQNTPWWEKGRVAPSPESWNPARSVLNQHRGVDQRQDVRDQRQDFRDHRQDFGNRRQFRRHSGSSVVYVLPAYGYFPYTYSGVTEAYVTPPAPTQFVPPGPPPAPPTPLGFLRLEVEPRESLQIFVDGIYIGSPADLGDEIALVPGVRRIEIRAPGYRTLTFDTEILEEQLITYRGALERLAGSSPRPPAAIVRPPAVAGPTTMYMIPGCYLGNVEPTQAGLRPGCDLSKLTTIKP
jgi:hypothetical protein